ncbi:MAG: fibrobacter succinogenes major paralogous domain-containing protein [Fibrobacter sp.]|nr:fibrobacter succinogenes major paralogous domain-containing protein [Fibrobacter sp.]
MAYTKWFAFWCFVIMLVACGDEGSSSVNTELTEMSVDNEVKSSSSSAKLESSSSNAMPESSFSSAKSESSSSSVMSEPLSSSSKLETSSSDAKVESSSCDKSSSSVNKNSSNSSEYKPYDGEVRKADTTDYYYKYDEVLNEWVGLDVFGTDRDLGLNGCTSKREGEIGLSPKDDIYYVCKHFVDIADGYDERKWVKAQEIDFIKRDEKCEGEDVGRIIPGIDTVTNNYYCSVLGWVNLRTWSFGVPKEFRFNPDINYGSLKDGRDGKTYKTVKIGNQVWMAENLNYAGGGIGHCYEDVPEYCEAGGRLYKWDVARDICPEGWHLPSKAEFDTLLSFVKLEYEEEQCSFADMFRAASGWDYGGQGCDKTGFSAVPAGGKRIKAYRSPEYNLAGYTAFFLTSTEYSETSVYVMRVGADVASLSIDDYYEVEGPCYSTKESEFSVRCLKDAE